MPSLYTAARFAIPDVADWQTGQDTGTIGQGLRDDHEVHGPPSRFVMSLLIIRFCPGEGKTYI